MRFEDLDKKIKEAAEQHHAAYDEKAWQKMEKLLDEQLPRSKKDRRRIIFLMLFFLLVGGGSFLLISKPWNKETSLSQPARDTRNTVQPNKQTAGKNQETPNQLKEKAGSGKQATEEKISSVEQNDVTIGAEKENEKESVSNQKNKNAGPSQLLKTRRPANNNVVTTTYDRKSISGVTENNTDKVVAKDDKQKQNSEMSEPTHTDTKTQAEKTKVEKIDNKNIAKEKENDKVIANTDQGVKSETKKSSKNNVGTKSRNGFSFSVSAGPDVSKVRGNEAGKLTLAYGAGVGYTRNRFTLRTGLYASRKIYKADAKYYKLEYTPPPYYVFESADADCYVLEIPVKLSYDFGIKNNSNWFAGAGLSSYLMKQEKYVYNYKVWGADHTYPRNFKNENKHYFSILNLSGGYTRQLSKSLSISAEPYVEIPMTGIGVGKVNLNSGGILFTLGVKPFRK